MKRIAILLAAYNGARWLEEQISSILQQTNVEVTIYVSIDLSNDETYLLVSKLALKEPRIIILPYGDIYGGAAKNFYRLICEVDYENYDYIALSDQDDVWRKNKLERACEFLKNNDFYSSNVIAFWENGKQALITKSQDKVAFDHFFESAGPGCTFVFKREYALQLKRFLMINKHAMDVELHDWLIYAFARENNLKWHIDSYPGMYYRQHKNNQVGANNSLKAIIKRIRLIKSGWYRNEIIKILNLFEQSDIPFRDNLCNKNYFSSLFLLKYIYMIRRRRKDRAFLVLMIIFGFF
ncbi:TPA: glycosyltransferase [Escherichia coli]|uniref:glycosyltransferase n=1 Tax=Escherichia coli TaxID=562 RepID=UPI0015C48F57|nr:glycosyltransferase [Escherichia coli]EFK6851044.1 glycosyltransferase [Escherichia coli]EFN7743957.1 glycosyltransferase [Escherichia coli]EGS9135695.1 glycosyltransferase [Escherichia coli]EHL5875118.1 glycosyltransferase [Escherichia coli]EHV3135326.1 glycosyltransferase [Escherichia coli]